MDLYNLVAKLTLDASGYNSGVQEADNSGRSLASNLERYMEKAKNVLKAVAIGAAIKKVASEVWQLVNAVSAAGDKIDKQSQSLGMSRKAYQEWEYILGQSGASIESMGLVMKTMDATIKENSADTAVALSKLGLTAAHLQSLAPEQQFEKLVRAFQQMPPSAQKSRYALMLFGRGAQELMPLLNSSTDSIDELKKRAQELGIIMSDEDVDAAVAFGDSLDDLTRAWTALRNKVGAQLLPAFIDFFKGAADSIGQISNALSEAFKTGDWTNFFRTAIDSLWNGVKGLIEGFGNTVIQALNSAFGTEIPEIDLSGVQSAFQWFVDNQNTIVTAVTAIVGAFAAGKIAAFLSALNPVSGAFLAIAAAIPLVAANWDSIKDWIGKTFETDIKWVQENWPTLAENFEKLIAWVEKEWKATVQWFNDGASWEDIDFSFTKLSEWVTKEWNPTVIWAGNQTTWQELEANFSKLGEWVNNSWNAIVSWTDGNHTWEDISNDFAKLGEWIAQDWEAGVKWFEEGWSKTEEEFKKIGEWVGVDWNAVVKWTDDTWSNIESDFGKLGEWVNSAWNATVQWADDTWTNIDSAFTQLGNWTDSTWEATVTWVNNAWNDVSNAFSEVGKWVGNQANTIAINFVSTVDSWIRDIKNWFSGAKKTIKAQIQTTADEFTETVKGWVDSGASFVLSISSTVDGWINTIKGWIDNGINIAANFFGNLGGIFGGSGGVDASTLSQSDLYMQSSHFGTSGGGGGSSAGHGFAKGLNYVPFDGYALLHRGETVLNQSQGREWRQSGGASIDTNAVFDLVASAVASAVGNIQINMDSRQVGNAVTDYVSRNIYRQQYGRRFATV